MIATFTISALLSMMFAAVAAATTDIGDICHEAEGDTSIAACTEVISSGTVAGEELAKAYMSRGLAQQKERRYAEAAKDFDEAVRVDPKSPTVFNLRGNLYQAIGQYDRAIQDYQSAIQNRPNYAAAFFNLGLAYSAVGDFKGALDAYNGAIALDQKNVSSYNNRCYVNVMLKNYDRAIDDCNHALELNPNHTNAFVGRGNARRYKGEYDLAIQDYDRAIALDAKTSTPSSAAASLTNISRITGAPSRITTRRLRSIQTGRRRGTTVAGCTQSPTSCKTHSTTAIDLCACCQQTRTRTTAAALPI